MSFSFGAAGDALLASPVRGAHWLIDLAFADGTMYLTTNALDIVSAGQTYRGLGQLLAVSSIQESEDSSTEKLTLSVPVVNNAMLAATLGNVESYRGRRVRLYLQLIGENFQPVGERVARWSGYMEPVKVSRTSPPHAGGAAGGRIELPCSRAGMARARNYEGLRLTHAQQQLAHPGDRGFEYVQGLIEQPALWLSKRFQEI